jgi:hypothetical protein
MTDPAGRGDRGEAGQSIADHGRARGQRLLGQLPDPGLAEALHAAQLEAHRPVVGGGLDGGDERHLARRPAAALAARAAVATGRTDEAVGPSPGEQRGTALLVGSGTGTELRLGEAFPKLNLVARHGQAPEGSAYVHVLYHTNVAEGCELTIHQFIQTAQSGGSGV